MIVCCIRYTLDPHRLVDFEQYPRRWPPIIECCGGRLIGYFLPREGANNLALALIACESLAAYDTYRAKLAADPAAPENRTHADRAQCILVEDRSFLRAA